MLALFIGISWAHPTVVPSELERRSVLLEAAISFEKQGRAWSKDRVASYLAEACKRGSAFGCAVQLQAASWTTWERARPEVQNRCRVFAPEACWFVDLADCEGFAECGGAERRCTRGDEHACAVRADVAYRWGTPDPAAWARRSCDAGIAHGCFALADSRGLPWVSTPERVAIAGAGCTRGSALACFDAGLLKSFAAAVAAGRPTGPGSEDVKAGIVEFELACRWGYVGGCGLYARALDEVGRAEEAEALRRDHCVDVGLGSQGCTNRSAEGEP